MKYWRGAMQQHIATSAITRLVSDPLYSDVLRHAASGALDFFDTEPRLNGTFADVGTFGLGAFALYLDATGGISHRRLADMSNLSTILSKGRASAILAILSLKGLASRGAPDQLGGPVRYNPEPQLKHFFGRRLQSEFKALTAIEPELKPILETWKTQDVFSRLIAHFGAGLVRAGNQQLEELKSLDKIGAHRAGFLVLYDLMLRAGPGDRFPSTEPFEIPVSQIARRFSIARSHVRKVLTIVEDAGVFVRNQSGSGGQFQPVMHARYAHYMAIFHIALMGYMYDAIGEIDPAQSLKASAYTGGPI